MTKADWLIAAGYSLLIIGLGMIYLPAAFIAAAAVCLMLARAASRVVSRPAPPEE